MKKRNFASSLKCAEDWQPALWKPLFLLTSVLLWSGKRPDGNTSERQNVVQRKL